MKKIDTIVEDIYGLFDQKVDTKVDQETLDTFANNIKEKLVEKLAENKPRNTLRISQLGRCVREQYYQVHSPEKREALHPWTQIKFFFGDVLEQLVLLLAKVAGHDVSNTQRKVTVDGIDGSIDGTVDNAVVDVKSAATRSMAKFRSGITKDNDDFGYWTQLGSYTVGMDSPDNAPSYFLAIDKQHGHIELSPVKYTKEDKESIHERIEFVKQSVAKPTAPDREYSDEPYGSSGNRALGTVCGYCGFKSLCWPGLRTFLYSKGPVYLTHVEREPDVPEAK